MVTVWSGIPVTRACTTRLESPTEMLKGCNRWRKVWAQVYSPQAPYWGDNFTVIVAKAFFTRKAVLPFFLGAAWNSLCYSDDKNSIGLCLPALSLWKVMFRGGGTARSPRGLCLVYSSQASFLVLFVWSCFLLQRGCLFTVWHGQFRNLLWNLEQVFWGVFFFGSNCHSEFVFILAYNY